MKNFQIIIGAVVVIGLLVFGWLFFSNKSSAPTSSITDQVTSAPASDNGTETAFSRYIPYSSGVLGSTSGKRVLYFYANWCPTCRPANEEFISNQDSIPARVSIIRVNYNDDETDSEEKALAEQYGITYQHTFVQINERGEEVTKWNGGAIEELIANIK